MKAAIYSPYLDTLGGGERYVITFAKVLSEVGWDVDIECEDKSILQKMEERFGMDLSKLRVVGSVKRGDGYDLCFWLSDGSVPRLLARKNILHFQRPFYDVDGKSLLNRMKMFSVSEIVVNSKFTKRWIDGEFTKESVVVYPPVDIDNFRPGRKENIILSVGRFSQLEQSKRQDVLVRAFKKFYDSGNRDWKMILVGGSDIGKTKFIDKLRKKSKGYPIEIVENMPFGEMRKLYAKSKIFWTASGYGIDEKKRPEKVEHFGITVVEAMSAGCVVFGYNSGGHMESIVSGKNGYLWKDIKQLVAKTTKVVGSRNFSKISKQAILDSKAFSYERFKNQVLEIISK